MHVANDYYQKLPFLGNLTVGFYVLCVFPNNSLNLSRFDLNILMTKEAVRGLKHRIVSSVTNLIYTACIRQTGDEQISLVKVIIPTAFESVTNDLAIQSPSNLSIPALPKLPQKPETLSMGIIKQQNSDILLSNLIDHKETQAAPTIASRAELCVSIVDMESGPLQSNPN
jgi:hypothetical protein